MTINVVTDIPDTRRLLYVCDFINNHPSINNQMTWLVNDAKASSISFDYNSLKEGSNIYSARPQYYLFDATKKRRTTSLKANSYIQNNKTIHSVEIDNDSKGARFFEDGMFAFDFFEAIFFHISRVEELEINPMDYVGDKFQFEKQLFSVRHELNEVPIVDDIIYALLNVFDIHVEGIRNLKFLSHDIDMVQLFKSPFDIVKKTGGIIYHRKSMNGFRSLWSAYSTRYFGASKKDPFDNFDFLLSTQDIDKRIYFLVGGAHKMDTVYDLKSPAFLNGIRLAKERDYNIGIHPSYESWNDLERIRKEKEKLEHAIDGSIRISRQHFLNFDISITPELLIRAGIECDSSLGYTRYIGYRCGTGCAYFLYNFQEEKKSHLLEEPLVFMDMAWLYQSIRENTSLLDLDKFYGAFNFHNSFFYEARLRKMNVEKQYQKSFLS